MFKFYIKYKFRILIILITIVILTISFISIVLYSQSKISENVVNYFANQTGNRGAKLGPEYLENKTKQVLITKYDVNHPQVSLVYLRYDDRQNGGIISSRVEHYSLNRQGFLDWSDVTHLLSVDVDNKPFSEAVAIAQKYDLSKENPDPANITVFAPLKPSSSSETVVYPQGVTLPNQGGSENK